MMTFQHMRLCVYIEVFVAMFQRDNTCPAAFALKPLAFHPLFGLTLADSANRNLARYPIFRRFSINPGLL